SIVGQRVMSIINNKSGNMEINVSQLEGGVYMVNLTKRDGTVTAHKIIVK
ncbi:MAG: T9SS type A sorting domain-containing protein, partial [Bacteroidales bacterium]|nr:T9SS type A sorting domain-containing protein [Bacteroidales bacterium]